MRVIVYPDPEHLAAMTVARLCLALADAGSMRPQVHVAIAGGSVGTAILGAVPASPLAANVDWSSVHVWWVDERFVPAGDPDRNEASLTTVFETLPIPGENIHRMPTPQEATDTREGARLYAQELHRFAGEGQRMPILDLVLLGMGPDGHIASLFPHHPGLAVDRDGLAEVTLGVEDSPKPPSARISLSLPALNHARSVWVAAWGGEKADAIARAVKRVDPNEIPAAGVWGREETLWLTDLAGAAQLPA